MKTVMEDLGLVESPRRHDGRLWFSDWTAGEIIAVDRAGASEVMIRHRSLPLCFDFLPDGSPVIVSGPAKALLRQDHDGRLVPYADLSALSEFGSNDIVVDGRGNTYVNNCNFDMTAGPPAGPVAPGFLTLVTPDGEITVVADDLAFPNGMAVTADNSTLVVAESYRNRLTAFDIDADGSLGARRIWAELGTGTPDGICIDDDGAVWYADVPHKGVSGSSRADRYCRPSTWTAAPSPACSMAPVRTRTDRPCSSSRPDGTECRAWPAKCRGRDNCSAFRYPCLAPAGRVGTPDQDTRRCESPHLVECRMGSPRTIRLSKEFPPCLPLRCPMTSVRCSPKPIRR